MLAYLEDAGVPELEEGGEQLGFHEVTAAPAQGLVVQLHGHRSAVLVYLQYEDDA
jgi:hypothetical protein